MIGLKPCLLTGLSFCGLISFTIKLNKGGDEVETKIKENLRENGQSLKWFWEKNLKKQISYKYFIMQINGHATIRDDVEKAISAFLILRK